MNFPVPWRALLPADAVPVVAGDGGRGLREVCDASGAGVDISTEGETPATLSDKICTISGSVEQKEAATRRIVDRLRALQEVADQEPGVFVIIVPSNAAPMVVGQKGAQIKEVIELSGAEISVGKENIIGMLDQPIGITGTGGQVVSAVSKINAILQDLADRGRLQPSDFKYRPGAVATSLMPGGDGPRGPAPSGGNPRTHAKFVVATSVAGWIIGKQGRHIRELQENSGAHIQVLKEGEVPPGVSPTDRIVEVGGRFEAKAEGIQIILMAIDSMPALQAPRETQMLVPKLLSTEAEVKDVQQMSGSEIEVRDCPGHEEALCTLLGTIEARVKAAQQFLTRLEEAMQDGSGAGVDYGAPRQAPPAREFPPAQPAREAPPVQREAPITQNSNSSDPWAQGDPWSQGKPGGMAPRREAAPAPPPQQQRREEPPAPASKTVSFQEPEVVPIGGPGLQQPPPSTTQPRFEPEPRSHEPAPAAAAAQQQSGSSFGAGGGRSSFSPDSAPVSNGVGATTSFSPDGPAQQSRHQGGGAGMQMSFSPDQQQQQQQSGASSFAPGPASQQGCGQMSFSPDPAPQQGGGMGQTSFAPGPAPQQGCGQMSFSPDPAPQHGSMGQTSFAPGPAAQQGAMGQTSFNPNGGPQQAGGQMSFSPDGGSQQCGMGQTSFSPNTAPQKSAGMQMSFSPDGGAQGSCAANGMSSFGAGGSMSFSPDGGQQQAQANGLSQTSFSPAGPGGAPDTPASSSFSPSGMSGFGGMNGLGGMGGGMPGMGMMGPMGMMGGMGGMDLMAMNMMGSMGSNEAMFRTALQASAMQTGQCQLMLLLSVDLLQRVLIPHGHLADIAQRCQIRIDLGADVPPNLRQVSLNGAVAANAMAALFLQERCLQFGGGSGAGGAGAGGGGGLGK